MIKHGSGWEDRGCSHLEVFGIDGVAVSDHYVLIVSKSQGTMRWTEWNAIELRLDLDAIKAAGMVESTVVASCLMTLRSEIARGIYIARWLARLAWDG